MRGVRVVASTARAGEVVACCLMTSLHPTEAWPRWDVDLVRMMRWSRNSASPFMEDAYRRGLRDLVRRRGCLPSPHTQR